jgi:hypothetical protein
MLIARLDAHLALLAVCASICVVGCPTKPAPAEVVEASPAATAVPGPPDVTELAPLADQGFPDAGGAQPQGPAKKWTGAPPSNANQLKIKQCCNALRTQAKQLGSSPEGNQLVGIAGYCDAMAAQVGPQGTAPEFNQLRQMLQSVKLPAVCQF